ncbi:MAG: Gfo/Idh/MocA family oxidoreductase [Terriglobales bacterium]
MSPWLTSFPTLVESALLCADQKIRVAVIGAGAFGRNHARVYRQLQQEGTELAAIVDTDAARAAAVSREFGNSPCLSLAELRGRVDAASVAVPTVEHLKVARALMEAGIDVLIEKPLAPSLAEADEIIRVAQRTGRVAQVGHLERFNPAVRATVPLLTRPMFFEVHRLSVFTPRSLDIDVILDLMIHDLDVVLSFVHSPVKEIRAVGLPILTPRVDIANVRMEFESGCVANFTASRVSTERVRKLRFFQPQQYISIDYSRQDVMVFTVDPSAAKASPNPGIGMQKPPVVSEEPLHAELRSFLDAVRNRTRPQVPLEDGRRALAVALDVLAEIREHSRRVGLADL